MAEFVPSYSITDFKKLKVAELKQLKSCEITSDGEYLFTYVNANSDYIKCSVEKLGALSNSVGGKSIDDILKREAVKC